MKATAEIQAILDSTVENRKGAKDTKKSEDCVYETLIRQVKAARSVSS
jgi:hypothetical protein